MEGMAYNKRSILEQFDETPTSNSKNAVESGGVKIVTDGLQGQINTLNTQIGQAFYFKGSSTYANLPASGNTVNDTYYVTDSDKKCWYTWNGTAWEQSSMNQTDYDSAILQLKMDMATVWSNPGTYNAGDYVINPNDNKLYVAKIQQINQAWTPANWEEVVLTEGLGDMILVQDTPPTTAANKIWLSEQNVGEGIEVPTMGDMYAIVAEEYDSNKTYGVGDYVIQNGDYWVCETAIETPELWDQSKWTNTSVGKEITNVKQDLYTVEDLNLIGDTRLRVNANLPASNPTATFTWNANKTSCTISGYNPSTTAGLAQYLMGGTTILPTGILPGQTYLVSVKTTSTDAYLGFYIYTNGSTTPNLFTGFSRSGKLSIPDNATGLLVFIALKTNIPSSNPVTVTISDMSVQKNNFSNIMSQNIAATYQAVLSYSYGDYCTYNETLYQCKVNIPAGQDTEFVPEHWVAVTATDEFHSSYIYQRLTSLGSYRFVTTDVENGGWISPGVKSNSMYRIRNKYWIQVHSGMFLNYSVGSYSGFLATYNPVSTTYSDYLTLSANSSGYMYISTDGYLIFSIKKDPESVIHPEEIESIDLSINFTTTQKARRSIPNNTDLNSVTDAGVYTLTSGYTYLNLPESSDGQGYVIVYRAHDVTSACLQILVPMLASNVKFYLRVCYTSGTWENWRTFDPDHGNKTIFSGTDWNELTSIGTYLFNNSVYEYTNFPPEVSGCSGFLFVSSPNSGQTLSQIIITYDSLVICRRQRNYSGTWGDWLVDDTTVVTSKEYLSAVVDSENSLLESQESDGKHFYTPVFAEAGLSYKGASTYVQDSPEYIAATVDTDGSILEYTTATEKVFETPVRFRSIRWDETTTSELAKALDDYGISFSSKTDWSDAKSLSIPEPRCAIVKISGIDNWPQSKTADLNAWMEFWDCQGNYFKKRIIFNAQGQSSMQLPKKNGAIDICNDEWEGDDTFSLRIGKWVPQDSFHLKAYYYDYFKGVAVISYQLMNDMLLTRNIWEDRPWKKALIDIENVGVVASNAVTDTEYATALTSNDLELDTGARNFPDGFPCIVYLNDDFYGLYSWQLKKHRDNYHMNKKNKNHIHLDGVIGFTTILGGTINWNPSTAFEIRNPKGLKLMDGSDYDGDATTSQELSETDATSAHVKTVLQNLSHVMETIASAYNSLPSNPSESDIQHVKDIFETYFDVDNLIDYQIVSDIVNNTDGFRRNWQWTTYDGVKWYINMYDVDMSFGAWGLTTGLMDYPRTTHVGLRPDATHYNPGWYIVQLYSSELETRYAYLRNKQVVDSHRIISMMNDWTSRYSVEYYDKEYKKWNNNASHRRSVLNNEYWELVGEGGPRDTSIPAWDADNSYNSGDYVQTQVTDSHVPEPATRNASPWYTFQAKKSVPIAPSSNRLKYAPVSIWCYYDSIYRFAKWVIQNVQNMDVLYHYSTT